MTHWAWIALGLVLAATEAVTATFVLIWFAIAAILVGILVWTGPGMVLWAQLMVFGALALALLVPAWIIRRRIRRRPRRVRPELINDRAAQHIGRTFVLAEPIAHSQGRAFIGDTLWQLRGPDLAAGKSVRITGVDGMTLKVEAIEAA